MPLDAGTTDAGAPGQPCDAGAPANPYATAQPFECNESLQSVALDRSKVKLPYDLVVPLSGSPKGIVVLLPGGSGSLALSPLGIGTAADNFCVRTREAFALSGYIVAVPDAPTDHPPPAGLDNFRDTFDHAQDLSLLIQHLRSVYASDNLHVWLIATSRGTISAVNVLSRLSPPQGPDAIVLTSSITTIPHDATDKEDIQSVPDAMAALTAAVPVLMIDEISDQCGASPPLSNGNGGGAQVLAQAIGDLGHFFLVDGGAPPPPDADVCGGLAYHGFYGEDEAVVGQILDFIASRP
jgi:hypothetical protein